MRTHKEATIESSIVYNVQPGPSWDWRIAVDLFLGGAGVGALLLAVGLDEVFKGRYRRISQTAAWLSPLLVTLGLVFLLIKLGHPLRLLLVYVNVAPTSPLWWGGIFQPLLVLGAFFYALMWRNPGPRDALRRGLGRALAPLAVIVGAYHGLLLSVMTARPLWNTWPTVLAAILGSVATGIAVVMPVYLIRRRLAGRPPDEEDLSTLLDDMKIVRNVLAATLVAQLGTCFLWWVSLSFGSLQDRQALAAANSAYGPIFWWLAVGLGLLLPLVLGGLVVLLGEAAHRRLQVTAICVTSGMILVGGFFFRLAVLLGGQVSLPVDLF